MRTPFFGPVNVSRSTNLADQRLVNLYPSIVENKGGKDIGALYLTDGLVLKTTVTGGPIQIGGMHGLNGVLYVVSGTTLYSVTAGFVVTEIGSVGTAKAAFVYTPSSKLLVSVVLPFTIAEPANGRVFMIDNGQQLLISMGLPVAYQDGFGVMLQPESVNFFQSDLLDFTTWDPLNFAEASGNADPVVGIQQIHLELFLIKENHTEVWVNAGTPGFVFQRLSGVYIEAGCVSPDTVATLGEQLMWLARNFQGQASVIKLNGYAPVRVSTNGLENRWSQYPRVDDAFAYTRQVYGHSYYVITFPSGNETWVYDDITSGELGTPVWHQLAAFLAGQFQRHWGNAYSFFSGMELIGDYRNGNIYAFDQNQLLDNGMQRKWLRSWRALPKPTMDPVRFSSLQIDMQTGIGVPDGTNPLLVLRWSDDGGHTWSNEHFTAAGRPGQTAARVQFFRLGSTKRNTGLDRIFELSSTDPFPAALIGAALT